MKEIKDILQKLQKGYDEKKPENAANLMSEIFASRDELLTLGTGSDEICLNRKEVEKLIHDDWDGGWGDFRMNIEGAEIEADNDVAWFFVNCTVKYSFEDSNDITQRYADWIKTITENQNSSPKQRLAFVNWVLALFAHQRESGKREYLWPSELSGMLVKENGEWKIVSLHFSVAKPNYPDERFEELIHDYQAGYNSAKNIIQSHSASKANDKLLSLLAQLEGTYKFDKEQLIVLEAGHFCWIIAIGTEQKSISEDEIFENSLNEIECLFKSDLSTTDRIFQAKRTISYALKEAASGTEFTWPVRLTAVVEKCEDRCIFRHKHFSYPFYWILEGKL